LHIAQTIAAEAVSQVLVGRNLNQVLAAQLRRFPHATPQQKAQAQHLSYVTLRFYASLRHMLNALLDKPLREPVLESLLLVALAQLHYDGSAPHTVVNQAVQAVNRLKMTWAKGLVNAVLRNFLRRQPSIVASLQQDLTAEWNYPRWWIEKVQQQYPQDWKAILQIGNQHPPMCLRVNQRITTGADYQLKLQQQGLESTLLDTQTLLLAQAVPVEQLPDFSAGAVSVQDYAAQVSASFLDVQAGMRVLDACAAPGGKTGHLLEIADLDLLALDVSEDRLVRVQSNLQRLQLTATCQLADAANVAAWWDGKPFDRILLDAPCSASGVVRRHVDIKWLRRDTDIASFAQQQAQLLEALWPTLARGGKLLYVTCSIFQEENHHQMNNFLQSHDEALNLPLHQVPANLHINHGQLTPSEYHDGLFYALLQKR
jgi:16S rRNA (cytosine967-C5)-methyltransferase